MSGQSMLTDPNPASWTKALLWKEIRQVIPLLLTVLGLGFGILLLIVLSSVFASRKGFSYDNGFWFLFLAMPLMYATGVGILLVGTEKESRSMQWMRSLPVSAKHIAWNKLLVALVSLALVWLIAWSSWAVFAGLLGVNPFQAQAMDIYRMNAGQWMLPTYVMVSLFLCVSGLAFAWKFESQVLSLVMLIPAALAVWCTAYGLAEYTTVSKSSFEISTVIDSGMYLGCLTIGSLIAIFYGWYASQHELSALAPPMQESASTMWKPAIFGAASATRSQSETNSAEAWSLWPGVTPVSAMLWQMIRQNGLWWSLIGILALLVLATGRFTDLYGISGPIDDQWIFYVLFPMGALAGLLGVLAFQSDGMRQQVRFYADRGVSPTMLWLTRHWIPVTMLLVWAIFRYLTLRSQGAMNASLILVDTAVLLGVCLAAYSIGQWVSQFIKSPILSAIVLPAVLLTNLAYCIFTIAAMEAPWWLLIVSFAIPAIATWWMMRPWMERRIDWKYFLQHGCFSLAAVIIPLVPGLWKIWNLPSMPSDVRSTLKELAMKSPAPNRSQNLKFGFAMPPYETSTGNSNFQNIAELLDRNEQVRKQQTHSFLRQAASPEFWLAPAQGPGDALKNFWAQLARLQNDLILAQKDPTLQSTESLEKYRSALADIPNLVTGLRASRSLKQCDLADWIELIALGHCKHTKAKDWMGSEVYQPLVNLLGDHQARDQARRAALASAWWESYQAQGRGKDNAVSDLDGYYIQYTYIQNAQRGSSGAREGSIPSSLAMLRGRDLLVSDLWKLLEMPLGSKQAAGEREAIASKNAYANRVQADGYFITVSEYCIRTPAELWRGQWEVDAKELAMEGASHE